MYLVLLMFVVAGCGRIGFDPPLGTEGRQDARAPASDGTASDDSGDGSFVCPAVAPTCELCGDLVAECTYGSVCCGCLEGTWNCSEPNPAGCPMNPPVTGTVCVTDGLYCTYCPFRTAACRDGMWIGDAVAC